SYTHLLFEGGFVMARIRSRSSMLFVAALVAIVAAGLVPLGAAGASSDRGAGHVMHGKVTAAHAERVGKVNVRRLVARGAAGQTGSAGLAREAGPWVRFEQDRAAGVRNVPGAPSPSNTSVVVNQNTSGWEGLDHTDQRFAGGGNQFSLEPPDQGLCVGGGS